MLPAKIKEFFSSEQFYRSNDDPCSCNIAHYWYLSYLL